MHARKRKVALNDPTHSASQGSQLSSTSSQCPSLGGVRGGFMGTALILMLRFGRKTDTANRMRMIGQLENEASARLFSDFLYAQGIENQTEPERSGAWALWIHAEEQMDAAKALLNQYRENPRDPKYQHASRVAEEKWKQEQKANASAEKCLLRIAG